MSIGSVRVVVWVGIVTLIFAGILILTRENVAKPAINAGNEYVDVIKEARRTLTYFRDTRTNVCFAIVSLFRPPSVTAVPCEQVKDYLREDYGPNP